ncbi:hypothetical protein D3C80_1793430 [compost metagenome]
MILTHISMSKHVIAKLLSVAQTGTMSQHQPGMWTQHSNMVGDGLCIGWANADIDHGNTGMIVALQVIGRHLWHTL